MSKNIHYATVANCDHDRSVRSGHLHHLWRGAPPSRLYAPAPSYLVNFDHGLAPTGGEVHSYAMEEGFTSLINVRLAVLGRLWPNICHKCSIHVFQICHSLFLMCRR